MVEQDDIIQAIQSENKDRAFQQNKKKKIVEIAETLSPEDLGKILVKLNFMHLNKMFPKDKYGKRRMKK